MEPEHRTAECSPRYAQKSPQTQMAPAIDVGIIGEGLTSVSPQAQMRSEAVRARSYAALLKRSKCCARWSRSGWSWDRCGTWITTP